MGFFDKDSGNRNYSVNAGRDISGSNVHVGDIYRIGDDNGPTCPHNWQIGFSTCGCCLKSNGCEKWHNLVDRTNRNLGDY